MKKTFRRFIALLALVTLAGQGCTKGLSPETQKASQHVDLNIWGVIDDVDVYQTVFNDYRALHPNVSINFKRFRLEEYESMLVNALAEDRGPDIFLIHNDWTGKYMPKIVPMPPVTKVGYSVVTGTIQKQQTWELRSDPTITNKALKDGFADAVLKDVLRTVNVGTADKANFQERAMALPISVDTLALYYNKDLLNAAGIPNPPETWDQFQEQVKKVTKLDPQGNIVQSGAALGTASNVERSADILSVLMMQNGARMADDAGSVQFQTIPPELTNLRDVPPAYQAVQFYTDFANPAKETYTWNAQEPNSLDAFIQGQTAFFVGYSYHLDQIKARAPKLNLGLTKLPQINGNPVKNFANYWMWAVSKKSANQDLSWNLLNYMITPAEAKKILTASKRPAALRSLLTDQLNDEDVGVFASQVLTAESWYRGNDPQAKDDALTSLINDVVTGAATIPTAVRDASDKIAQTIY